jgi:hypothetical protein
VSASDWKDIRGDKAPVVAATPVPHLDRALKASDGAGADLAIIDTAFCGFGVLSRTNPTTLAALALGAFAVASGIYLILDLSAPYSGLFRVPTAGLEQTIKALDNCAPRCERAGDRGTRD